MHIHQGDNEIQGIFSVFLGYQLLLAQHQYMADVGQQKVLVGMLHVILKNGHINIFAHRITGLRGKSVPGISGLCDVCARTLFAH